MGRSLTVYVLDQATGERLTRPRTNAARDCQRSHYHHPVPHNGRYYKTFVEDYLWPPRKRSHHTPDRNLPVLDSSFNSDDCD